VREETTPAEIPLRAARVSGGLNNKWEEPGSKMRRRADNIKEIRGPSGETFILSRT
jgi:hypothetical protein